MTYLCTVVQSAAWNCRTMVSKAGSMYQMEAKMKEMMDRLAMPQTTPISTSSSHVVSLDHCCWTNSVQPLFLWNIEFSKYFHHFSYELSLLLIAFLYGTEIMDFQSSLHFFIAGCGNKIKSRISFSLPPYPPTHPSNTTDLIWNYKVFYRTGN